MALTLNSATLANPVEVLVDGTPLVALNIAYGGIRYYHHATSPLQKHSIHTIEVRWGALTSAELGEIRTRWKEACNAYVYLAMDGLLLSDASLSDTAPVMVAPGTALDVAFLQAYNGAGTGPILYDASAIFITAQLAI